MTDAGKDGRNDLVVGEWDFNGKANLLLYHNIGTPEVPNLVLRQSALLKVEQRVLTTIPPEAW